MKELKNIQECPENADISTRTSWLDEQFDNLRRTGIQWTLFAQQAIVSVPEDQPYDIIALQNPNHLFDHLSVLIPMSLYKDYTPGTSMTVVLPDIHGNRRRVLVPGHIHRALSSETFLVIRRNLPSSLEMFHLNCFDQRAESLIDSLRSTSDLIHQSHSDVLEIRLGKLELLKLTEWKVKRAELLKLHRDYESAVQRGLIDFDEGVNIKQWRKHIAKKFNGVLKGIRLWLNEAPNVNCTIHQALSHCDAIAADLAHSVEDRKKSETSFASEMDSHLGQFDDAGAGGYADGDYNEVMYGYGYGNHDYQYHDGHGKGFRSKGRGKGKGKGRGRGKGFRSAGYDGKGRRGKGSDGKGRRGKGSDGKGQRGSNYYGYRGDRNAPYGHSKGKGKGYWSHWQGQFVWNCPPYGMAMAPSRYNSQSSSYMHEEGSEASDVLDHCAEQEEAFYGEENYDCDDEPPEMDYDNGGSAPHGHAMNNAEI
jgi:hypothetical protein